MIKRANTTEEILLILIFIIPMDLVGLKLNKLISF